MVKKIVFFALLIFLININNSTQESCQKIECSSTLSKDVCIKVLDSTSLLQECTEGKICSPDSDDPVNDATCIEYKENNFKRLPTLPCEKNEDCLSGSCSSGTCLGKIYGENCISASGCIYGYTCRKDSDNTYKCLDPITTGNKCEKDSDCVHESGCLDNICTKYFSVENNGKGNDIISNSLSFCKSGYSNFLGICQNLSLINEVQECNEENKCTYNNTLTGELIIKEENCLCGYNPEGKKYCTLGSANKNYTKYLYKLKEYYLNNKNCHLSERTDEGCQKDLLSDDNYIRTKIHELINAKYWAKSNNKLIGAPICAYKVELPDYDGDVDSDPDIPPIPGEGQCAIYKCEKTNIEGFCAKSNYMRLIFR